MRILLLWVCVVSSFLYAKPFWTEKSSYVEGDKVFLVGVSSGNKTVEQGRLRAIQHAKEELANFFQVKSIGDLTFNTQMTYEEWARDKTVTVYRLMWVSQSELTHWKAQNLPHPEWFHKIQAQGSGIMIGYGKGDSFPVALTMAKSDIASLIQSELKSETVVKSRVSGGKQTDTASVSLRDKTQVSLSGIKVIRKQQHKGQWYVAVQYENLPFEKRFAREMATSDCGKTSQNRYLASTPLIISLNKDLGCAPDVSLSRDHGMWYLSKGNHMVDIRDDELERLFVSADTGNVQLEMTAGTLSEGEAFSFTVISKYDGYVSLLNVYENGVVAVVSANAPIQADKKLRIPDPDGDKELVAGLLRPGASAEELYVGLLDKTAINLDRFQNARNVTDESKGNFKFGELIDFLGNRDFASVVVRIVPAK